jgi:hypothetical protein
MIFPEQGAPADIFADRWLTGIIRFGSETAKALKALQKIGSIQSKNEFHRMLSLQRRNA